MQRRAFVQKLAVGAGLCLLPPGWLLARPYSRADGKADWIFRGGLIHTVDPARPTAEAGRFMFRISPERIHSTRVVQTMMDGKVTHALL